MKNFLIILIALMMYASPGNSQVINKEPLSNRQTGYDIDAKLDPSTKTVTGIMKAFWVNKSAETVPAHRPTVSSIIYSFMPCVKSILIIFYCTIAVKDLQIRLFPEPEEYLTNCFSYS